MVDVSRRRLNARLISIATACLFVVGSMLPSRALSDEWDKKTVVTFNNPVQIPGKVLPAGTYVFKVLDSSSSRDIVQIFDKDEKRLIATTLAVPNYRLQPSGKPIVTFDERPPGTPMAVKAWFYPGDNYGHQFVYPHQMATQLAKANNQNVLSMADDMNTNMATQSRDGKSDSLQQLQRTDVNGVDSTGEPVVLEMVIAVRPATGDKNQ